MWQINVLVSGASALQHQARQNVLLQGIQMAAPVNACCLALLYCMRKQTVLKHPFTYRREWLFMQIPHRLTCPLCTFDERALQDQRQEDLRRWSESCVHACCDCTATARIVWRHGDTASITDTGRHVTVSAETWPELVNWNVFQK